MEWIDSQGRRRKPTKERGRPAPPTCWKCDEPSVEGRAVCATHAAELEQHGAWLRNRPGRRKRKATP